jgi:hypothetical protein
MNKTANFKVINTHWVYSHRYALLNEKKKDYGYKQTTYR